MNTTIELLSPKSVWKHFKALNAVPRGSKKEEQVIAFMERFGNHLGLETLVDGVGNVIIRKPATPGMEHRKPVIMQSHLDMVHQKNNDTEFDFDTEGIRMIVDDDWVRAEGTTLGADNGMGVATIMAVLESDAIAHPDLEALFTIDEETGMTGAKGLEGGLLKGEILLNLDTEEDDELGVGCAGGIDITGERSVNYRKTSEGQVAWQITITGLNGGHSGMDIHKGLGNANKLMNRVLVALIENAGGCLASIDGGGLRNAIPRESQAVICIPQSNLEAAEKTIETLASEIKAEYKTMEPGLRLRWESTDVPSEVLVESDQGNIVRMISGLLNGVYRMSPDIPELVETSNNVARIVLDKSGLRILCLTRSSVESAKMDLALSLKAVLELGGCSVSFSGDYPGWTPNMDSPILKVMRRIYVELNGSEPHVAACHAGLECGILGTHYPKMDMISFGPNIKGAHSPDERVQISSVEKFWTFVLEILKQIPERE